MTFIHIKLFIYGHIHPYMWIKITLNIKLQAPSLGFISDPHLHKLDNAND
jgi:hypothetical protein